MPRKRRFFFPKYQLFLRKNAAKTIDFDFHSSLSPKVDMCEFFPLNKRQSPRKRRFWKETAKKDAVGGGGLRRKILQKTTIF